MPKRVEFSFDPFKLTELKKPKGADRDEILEEVSDFVLESVLDYVGNQLSPVKKHGWKKSLSKAYEKEKKKAGASPVANMELSGKMLDSLKAEVEGRRIVLGVSEKESPKADNHNKFSAKSKKTDVPERRFIPAKGETFKQPIIDGMKRIIKVHED